MRDDRTYTPEQVAEGLLSWAARWELRAEQARATSAEVADWYAAPHDYAAEDARAGTKCAPAWRAYARRCDEMIAKLERDERRGQDPDEDAMKMALTESQYDKLIHATGRGEDYRSHYTVGDGPDPDWEAMCKSGHASAHLHLARAGRITYHATHAGLAAARAEYTRRQRQRGLRRYAVRDADDHESEYMTIRWARSHAAARWAVARDAAEYGGSAMARARDLRVRLAEWEVGQ